MQQNHPQENDLPAGLARPAIRALVNSGITRIEQVSQLMEKELSQLHGIGPNAIKQIRAALESKGLTFRT